MPGLYLHSVMFKSYKLKSITSRSNRLGKKRCPHAVINGISLFTHFAGADSVHVSMYSWHKQHRILRYWRVSSHKYITVVYNLNKVKKSH